MSVLYMYSHGKNFSHMIKYLDLVKLCDANLLSVLWHPLFAELYGSLCTFHKMEICFRTFFNLIFPQFVTCLPASIPHCFSAFLPVCSERWVRFLCREQNCQRPARGCVGVTCVQGTPLSCKITMWIGISFTYTYYMLNLFGFLCVYFYPERKIRLGY